MDRLTEVLERLVTRQAAPPLPVFKTLTFDGKGDVDYFIQQFGDVVEEMIDSALL